MATEIPLVQLATPAEIEAAVALVEGIQPDLEAVVAWGLAAETGTVTVAAAVASVTASAASAASDAEVASDAADEATNALAPVTAIVNGRLSQASLDNTFGSFISAAAYGATGDGVTNDRAAIQAALNAAATKKRAVLLPIGTYLVDKATSSDFMLTVPAGVTFRGESQGGSVIKVKAGTGDYRTVITGVTAGTNLSNVTVENLTIDQNSTNNPVTVPATLLAGFPRYAFYAAVGDGITVRNVTFRDIDATNTVVIAGTQITDARIQDCKFKQVGTSATVHDYSAIYTSGVGHTITGNVFEGVLGGKGAMTAIETHGSSQVVTGNRVRDFFRGANITGVANVGNDNLTVTGNVFTNVAKGIDLWSYAGSNGLRNCDVSHNVITVERDAWLAFGDFPRGISVDPTATQNLENIKIQSNTIVYNPWSAAGVTGELAAAGIQVAFNTSTIEIRNLDIYDNTVVGALSAGLRISAVVKRGRISRNRFVDPGSSNEAAMAAFYKSGMTLVGSFTDVLVDSNQTFDTRGTHRLAQGVMTSLTLVTGCAQWDNTVSCTDAAILTSFVQTVGKPFSGKADSPLATSFTTALYYGPEGGRSTVAAPDGTLFTVPFFVSNARGFDRIGCEVTVAGAASSVVRMGIYRDNGSGIPSTLVLDAGTVAADSIGAKELTVAVSLPAGLYWLAAAAQGGAPTIRAVGVTANVPTGVSSLAVATGATPRSGYTQTGVSGALPATFVQGGQSAAPALVVVRAQ